jgi:predicted enzyme related to lactoylglutathione lyase
MSERSEYTPGTPAWIDLGSPDLDVTHAFYTGLFGWELLPAGPVELTGGYGFYTQGGKRVAGYGPSMNPEAGVFWSTYVATADVDATTAAVVANGGTVIVPPMDVMTAGRMAVFIDPTGAQFSAWQAGDTIGSEVVNEPGAFTWSELWTRDIAAARAFYGAVFGWTNRNPDDAPYTEFQVGDALVAGGMAIPPNMPPQLPAHWNVYFAVVDIEAATAKAQSLGGMIRQPPMEIPDTGIASIIGGPHHEGFSLIQLANG